MTITERTTRAALPEGVAFKWVPPGDLLLDADVRSDARITPDFLTSVRDLGVLTPVVAARAPEGLRVQKGQRRTIAAVQVGCSGVPVYVVPDGGDVERNVGRLAENRDREAMTATDNAAAYQQLALLGLSAATIAKRTRRPKAEVIAGLTVAASAGAAAAAQHRALDLPSAALFAEFEDDEAVSRVLTVTAERGGSLAHAAQRIRDDRTQQAAIAATRESLQAESVATIHQPGYRGADSRAVAALRAKGSAAPLTPREHAACPGHAAWIQYDRETG